MITQKENTLFCFVGKTGSGKTFLAKNVAASGLCELITTTTTRLPRDGEENGVDYNFISKEKFLEMLKEEEFLEHVDNSGNLYGFEKKELEKLKKTNCLVILTPSGVKGIKQIVKDVRIVYVDSDDEKRIEFLTKRDGGELSEASGIRIEAEELMFNDFKNKVDCTVFKNNYSKDDATDIQRLVINLLFDLGANEKVDRDEITKNIKTRSK